MMPRSTKTIAYQPAIDGLRSIAILSVLLFHVGFSELSGGYVGVDVFFVISGFLITRLIHHETSNTQSFSYVNFYVRRARRLMPALFVTLLLTLLVGIWLFSPLYLERLGLSVAFSTFSLANVFFWTESGYFDNDAIFKPLLHTWSLSVEEQFYLFWPALLVLASIGRHKLFAPLLILSISIVTLFANPFFLSGPYDWDFGLAEIFQKGEATIFFLTPFRIFEFGIGALLVWILAYKPGTAAIREICLATGLGMIFYAVICYDESTVFPSFNALLPCIGTALAIYGAEARVLGKLIANKLAVNIGLISYSLYLVHWPLIVFFSYRYPGLLEQEVAPRLWLCAAAFALATLSYHFVEKPFRHGAFIKRLTPTALFSSLGLAAAALTAAGITLWSLDGLPRNSEEVISISTQEFKREKALRYSNLKGSKGCGIRYYIENGLHCNNDANVQVLVLGNSHAIDAYNALHKAYADRDDVNVTHFTTTTGCDFRVRGELVVNEKKDESLMCDQRAVLLNDIEFIRSIDVLAFSAFKPKEWGRNIIDMTNHIRRINPEINIVFFGTYIGLRPQKCSELINEYGNFEICRDESVVSHFDRKERKDILALPMARKNFIYIDKHELFCADRRLENCLVEYQGKPVFYDGDHLSLDFAEHLGDVIKSHYQEGLQAMGL